MSSKKGQNVMYGFFIFIFLLITFTIMLDPINYFIDLGINETQNRTHGDLLGMMFNYIPVFIALALFMMLFVLVVPR